MRPRAFEELAFAHWERIPAEYKQGIDGVRVLRRAMPHDELPDIYTLGECVTEAYPSDYGGPDTIRSAVVLYWGSFAALADQDRDFDWEAELWETLTHELRHHLESLASEDALEDVDYAADENFKRFEDEPFDPLFYRAGEPVPPDLAPRMHASGAGAPSHVARGAIPLATWRIEGEWFIELEYPTGRPPAGEVELEWLGARHAFRLPALDADVTFALLSGGFAPPPSTGERIEEASLVLVRRASMWRAALDALQGRSAIVAEIELDVTSERM